MWFSSFNQYLLCLFDVSNASHDNFLAKIEAKMCQKYLKYYHEMCLKR